MPGAAPGKGFAECKVAFAGSIRLPAKRPNPIVHMIVGASYIYTLSNEWVHLRLLKYRRKPPHLRFENRATTKAMSL